MKDIKYYKNLNYKMTFNYDPEDKIYIVQFPELPGCIAHGKTAREALKNSNRVKDEWLESAFEDKWIIPEPSLPLETTGRITLRLPKSIHQMIIDRAEEEDISQNQLLLAYISEGLERTKQRDDVKEILQKQTEAIENINKCYDLISSKILRRELNIPKRRDEASTSFVDYYLKSASAGTLDRFLNSTQVCADRQSNVVSSGSYLGSYFDKKGLPADSNNDTSNTFSFLKKECGQTASN